MLELRKICADPLAFLWQDPNKPASTDLEFSRRVLGEVHLKVPLWQRLVSKRVVITTTFVAVTAYVLSLVLAEPAPATSTQASTSAAPSFFNALAGIAAGATFALSYVQWHLARHEISFDKFYEKLNITNQTINACGLREAKNPGEEIDHLRNMRTFAQLDNLEYVLGKYRLGFVEFDLVDRAIRTFRSDCDIPWFAEKVIFWIGAREGAQVAKGYHAESRKAARYIVGQCRSAAKP
jgi:hypothetical protein